MSVKSFLGRGAPVFVAALFAFAWLASGRLVDAVIYAVFYFVVAMVFAVFRLRRRIANERE